MELISDLFLSVQAWLFEMVIQPVLFHLGMSSLIEDAYVASMWLLLGLLQLVVLIVVLGAAQRWRPIEAIVDRQQIRVDMLYTMVHRLGLFRLGFFFLLDPVWDGLFGQLHVWGLSPLQIDQYWPGVTDRPWVSLIIYLIVFDLVEYIYHRAQHRYNWLWALHAVHHSQRQMTMWTDNRNHILDDIIHSTVIVFVAQIIGVPPAQFVAVVVITQLLQSLSHANIRVRFGRIGDRLLVGPLFHRWHHAIAYDAARGGHNFSVLFPVWDIVFKTANFSQEFVPTGIYDQLATQGNKNYGRGFWAQQWLALRRMVGKA